MKLYQLLACNVFYCLFILQQWSIYHWQRHVCGVAVLVPFHTVPNISERRGSYLTHVKVQRAWMAWVHIVFWTKINPPKENDKGVSTLGYASQTLGVWKQHSWNILFGLKLNPKLELWFLKLEGAFSWVGIAEMLWKSNATLPQLCFSNTLDLNASVNSLGPIFCLVQ